MTVTRSVRPVGRELDAEVRPPGSKSITNRALICAALASGVSTLRGALFADDTRAMMDAVRTLGAGVEQDETARTVVVRGGGAPAPGAVVDARQSGTTSRFVLPAAALFGTRTVVDGTPQLRARRVTCGSPTCWSAWAPRSAGPPTRSP